MSGKLGEDAFEYYVSLGEARSYRAVAEHFGVTKRAVSKRAARDSWSERLSVIAQEVREVSDRRLVETLEEMGERHLRILRVIQSRALEALRAMPLATAMEAVRALDMSIRQERVIRGEPSDRTEVALETVVRREYERWMKIEEDCDGEAGHEQNS